MKKFYLIVVLLTLLLGFSGIAYADQWVDVGPTSMPLSDLSALQQMAKGKAARPASPQSVQSVTREFVDVGMASMPRVDFLMIAGLVRGNVQGDENNYTRREKMVDFGIVSIRQTEMNSLTRMVQNGLLQHWHDRFPSNIAVE